MHCNQKLVRKCPMRNAVKEMELLNSEISVENPRSEIFKYIKGFRILFCTPRTNRQGLLVMCFSLRNFDQNNRKKNLNSRIVRRSVQFPSQEVFQDRYVTECRQGVSADLSGYF